jgi:DNA-binding response OmpR family regulator
LKPDFPIATKDTSPVPNERDALRVLIVDDERMIADTLAQILNASGFAAKAVYDGAQAVAEAQQFYPDILLTDVIMRGMSGVDTGIRVAQALPQCRVILFSGQASTADLLDGALAQGYEFEMLAKPIHPQELVKILRSPRGA